jgi:membrane-anchored protein YejM (alkaline phosphatase superfamily)
MIFRNIQVNEDSKLDFKRTFFFYLVIFFVILVIVMAMVFAVCACRHSRKPIYVQPTNVPVQYRLLSHDEGSTNNLIVSDTESEEEKI